MTRRLLQAAIQAAALCLLTATAAATQAPTPDGPIYRTVTRTFYTDSYYTKGLLARELTADVANRPFIETEQTFVLKNIVTHGAGDAASTTATLFPQLVRTNKRFYESQSVAGKASHTLHDYDALGNVVCYFDAGDSGANDDVDAYLAYGSTEPACAARHIVGVALCNDVIGDGQAAVTDLGYDTYGSGRVAV